MNDTDTELLRRQADSLREEAESLRSKMDLLWQQAEEIEAKIEAAETETAPMSLRP